MGANDEWFRAFTSPISLQQALTHLFLVFKADNRRNVTTHCVHGSRNRSVEIAVPKNCCCPKQRTPLSTKTGNEDDTGNATS